MNKFLNKSLIKLWLRKNSDRLIKTTTKYGTLYLLKNDEFITDSFLKGKYWAEYEIKIIEDLLNFKNINKLIYFDVGANIGSHTLALSKIFQNKIEIYCFEAQSFISKILEANIYENNLNNVKNFHCAVSDNYELIKVRVPNYDKINNFGSIELRQPKYSDNDKIIFSDSFESISSIKLDDFKNDKVNFIKIDVEGMEHFVIKGGRELIKNHRPFLFMELVKTETETILNFFKEIDYSAYQINTENGLFIPNELKVPIRNLKKLYY